MRKPALLLVLCSFCVLLTWTCRKAGTSWDTDITSPLFKTTFGIDNLVSDTLLSRNTDSSMTLVYHNPLYNYSIDTLFHIRDTTLPYIVSSPFTHIFNPGDPITPSPNTQTTVYSLNGVGLKKAILRSGKLVVSIRNDITEKILFNYQIPCATLNSIPFSVTALVPAATSPTSPGIYTATFDLSGYSMDLSGPNHNAINTLTTALTANIDPAGNPVTVVPSQSVNISNSFIQLVPEYGRGYFGQAVQHVGPSETHFNIFNKIISGAIQLSSVQLNFSLENSVGVDGQLNISDIYSRNSKTGNIVHLTAPIINSPLNVNRAIELNAIPPVVPTNFSTVLNNTNSNAKALLENLPDYIGYQLGLTLNPLGNVSGYGDFVYYGYGLKASLDMQMPLSLVANNLTLADTLAVNFDNVSSNVSRLHKCTLTLFAENGFPLDAAIQMFIFDPQTQVKDSLIGAVNTIDEAPVDANYKAVGKRQTILVIPVSEDKINKLIHTRKIVILARFNTSSKPNFIKIYSSYQIDFKLTGDFSYTIKLH